MGRHHEARRLSPTTWVAGLAGLAVVGAIALAMAPANAAATTVDAQLTLSGVAWADQPTGGSTVGVHPGDSVHLTAAAVPTAGAPGGLSSVLGGVLGGVAGMQVKITSGNLPGVKYPYVLGKVAGCSGGNATLAENSLAKGTYNFKYVVQTVTIPLLGGCKTAQVTPTKDQLGTLTKNNVKVTDNAIYSGSIVAAADPPKGTIGVQLPSNSASVKVGPIHTSVGLPGATVGITNPVPSITKKLGSLIPKGGSSTKAGGKKSSAPTVKYTPPALTVPEKVMPHAVNYGGSGGTGFAAPGGGGSGGLPGYTAPAPRATTTAAPQPTTTNAADIKPAKTTEVASKQTLGGAQLPVLLAILAVLALASVTGMYAKMYLLRGPSK